MRRMNPPAKSGGFFLSTALVIVAMNDPSTSFRMTVEIERSWPQVVTWIGPGLVTRFVPQA